LSWNLSIIDENNHKIECKIPQFSASFDWTGILEKVLDEVEINPADEEL
jgi:hypothetical protein